MWRVITCVITLPGLVAKCALHRSVWLHGGDETLTAWQGVSAVVQDQALKKKNVLAITHQEKDSERRRGSEEEAKKSRQQRAGLKTKRELTALRSPFYKPRVKGGMMTQSDAL